MVRFAVVLVLLSACSYIQVHPHVSPPRDCGSAWPVYVDGLGMIGSLGVALAGGQVIVQEPTASHSEPAVALVAGSAAAVVFLVSSLHGNRLLSECRDAPVGDQPEVMERVKTREEAYALTKQARDAARAGDCAKVKSLAPQVKAANAEFYDVVFSRDAAIAKCM